VKAGIRLALLLATAFGPLLAGVVTKNRRLILVSVVLSPLLLGLVASTDPRPTRGLRALVALTLAFELVFGAVLYFVWLRLPWG
jgi:hypothetical protein